jgi:hypothetical protein
MAVFDIEKFKTIIHFVVDNCEDKPNFGKTVLFKLLYFSDFNFYELYEEKLTGADYERRPFGPAPLKPEFDKSIEELEEENAVIQKREDFDDEVYQFRYF